MAVRCARGYMVLAVCGLFVACGGRAELDARASAPSNGGNRGIGGTSGTAGTPSIGGTPTALGGAGSAGLAPFPDGSAGTPLQSPVGCPASAVDAACPSGNLLLDLHATTVDPESGLYVEPLQAPDYGTRPDGYTPSFLLPDPSTWDRSARPSGACVFRIHGVAPSCLRTGELFAGGCPAAGMPGVSPGSFYDAPFCGQAVGPGCPTSDPWSSVGSWWYLQPDGANVDLVVCAPECETAIAGSGGACLRLLSPL